jgi:tRNA pseudouridine13 synthase
LKTDTFELSYLGRSDSAVGRAGFDRNRFTIVVRDLWEGDVRHWRKVLDEIREDGLPNYFDSQRFGSVTDDFIARRMMRGQWEEALRLAIGTPRQEDRGKARKVKATLREHWGDWEKCSALPPPEGRIAKLLSRKPDAWAAAFELLDKHLRLLYASAYQSWLWNRALERLLQAHVMPSQLFRKAYAQGELLFYRRLPARERERFLAMKIPFPRRGVKFDDSEVEQAVTQVIKEEGFELKDLRIPGKSTYFGRGERAAVVVPQGMSATEPESDELNAGRLKLTLRFELPKGSYATVLIKRVFH